MKCISDELIQKHIDSETSAKEEAFIISHCGACEMCTGKIEKMRQTANHIKNSIGSIDEKDIEIPLFRKPEHQRSTLRSNFKYMIYAASAACLLILSLLFFQKTTDEVEYVISYELEGEFNANLPVSEQEMVIEIIDPDGNITKY